MQRPWRVDAWWIQEGAENGWAAVDSPGARPPLQKLGTRRVAQPPFSAATAPSAHRAEPDQLDARRQVVVAHGLLAAEVGRQILLVAVGEHRDDGVAVR